MESRRRFSNTFKRQVVEEYLSGGISQAQLARRYDLAPHQIIQWRENYASGKLVEKHPQIAQDEKVKDLERMVRRLTMENDLLKKDFSTHSGREAKTL